MNIVEIFKGYVDSFESKDKEITQRYKHSIDVMELMGELAYRLGLSDEEIKLARLIGLLHDIGRFVQWDKYKTFKDKDSVDHAEVGADYLFKEGHIRDYIEDDSYDSIIEKAIRNHNKFEIDDNLSNKELMYAKMIRDTDKIGIFKEDAINSEIVFDAKEVSSEVLEEFKNEKCVSHDKCKNGSDLNINTLSFIFDINFNESFDLLVETDNFDLYLSVVNVSEDSEKLWNKIREICFDKINRGVGE